MSDNITVSIEPTPNPNSMKFTTNKVLVEKGTKSFSSPKDAEQMPLAKGVFQISGVKSVFMMGNFISVIRDPMADWETIAPQVEDRIKNFFTAK